LTTINGRLVTFGSNSGTYVSLLYEFTATKYIETEGNAILGAAFTEVKGNVLTLIGKALTVTLGIIGSIMAVRIAIRFFRRAAR